MPFTAALGFMPAWAWRWIAILVACAALFGYGYLKGLHHQEAIDEQRFSQIREAQDKLALHAGKVAVDRDAALASVVYSYEDDKSRVAQYYAGRLRDATARSHAGPVPANQVSCGSDEKPADAGPDPAFVELEARCAETTLMLIGLQKAARAVETIR